MFDHLGPLPSLQLRRKKSINISRYFFLLSLAVTIFIVTWSVSTGPQINAALEVQPQLAVRHVKVDQNIVVGSPNLNFFTLELEASAAGIALQSLLIQSQGLYSQEDFLANLKLYHRGLQLGQLSKVDSQGKLYFDLNGYVLPVGKNEIILSLADSSNFTAGDLVSFSLDDTTSLSWSYAGKEYLSKAEWPLATGVINMVSQGSIWAYNNSLPQATVIADQSATIGQFSLAIDAESIDIKKIILELSDDNLVSDFSLSLADQVLAKASSDHGKIEFILDQPLAMTIANNKNFTINGTLPVGEYDFMLTAVYGQGFISGKEIVLSEVLPLTKLRCVQQLPEFSVLPVDKSLSQDWVSVAHLSARNQGQGNLEIYRLTWRLDSQSVDFKDIKLLVNDQIKDMDILIKDNLIVAKAPWSDPIILSSTPTDIKLLIKVEEFQAGSIIQSSLLGDVTEYREGQWSDQLLWSSAGLMHNAYGLANLPLTPQLVE